MNTLKNKAEKIYLQELKKIESQLAISGVPNKGRGITYGSQLANLASKLFGNKFKGIYASDETETLKEKNGYYIFNLDKRDEPGSHWCGIVRSDDGILAYDSFARDTKEILPSIYSIGNVKDTEDDAEQLINEDNCGSRVLAFLKVYDDYGPAVASWI